MAVKPGCTVLRSFLARKYWHLMLAISVFTCCYLYFESLEPNKEVGTGLNASKAVKAVKQVEHAAVAVKQDLKIRVPKISRVAIVDSGEAQHEVIAALISTFGRILRQSRSKSAIDPLRKISLYSKHPGKTRGFRQLMGNIYPNVTFAIHKLEKYKPLTEKHGSVTGELEILVMTACEQDVYNVRLKPARLSRRFIAICIVHQPGYLHAGRNMLPMFQEWVKVPEKIRFITLSPHMEYYLNKRTFPNHWGKLMQENGEKVLSKELLGRLRTGWFVPVIPAPLDMEDTKQDENQTIISIPTFESNGRNYTHIFASLDAILHPIDNVDGAAPPPNVHIQLIGSGRPPNIPDTLKNHVTVLRKLSHREYYKALGTSTLLVPAFGTPDYYFNKSSSSIPASIIAGIPILTSRRVLNSYDYLSLNSVVMQEEWEEDMEAVVRAIEEGTLLPNGAWGKPGLKNLKKNVRRMRERLIEENVERVAKLLI
ncbi:hypothetical protein HK104_001089 [Borealophlyctis nickersoniae]|nr:hypothetical protein HK104_001089 [Borealophlyctis nickersoniae]